MKTPLVKKWAEELLTTRNQHTNNKKNWYRYISRSITLILWTV